MQRVFVGKYLANGIPTRLATDDVRRDGTYFIIGILMTIPLGLTLFKLTHVSASDLS